MATIAIQGVHALQILDSRGNPTVRVTLVTDSGRFTASAPSGASTGAHEAVELRDGGDPFGGRGVTRAVAAVHGPISGLLAGRRWPALADLDRSLCDLDGTADKSRLGSNAIVAVSMAAARAFAGASGVSLHRWIASEAGTDPRLPVPHFNVLNGGAHAANALDFQEFMIAPLGMPTLASAVRCGAEVYHCLAALLREQGLSTGLGDEGGFAPEIERPEQALDLLCSAIAKAGYRAGADAEVAIAIDPAANGFYRDGEYALAGASLSRRELVDLYTGLLADYPVWSLEDGMAEDDDEGWRIAADRLTGRVQLVGDDNIVTSPPRIDAAARAGTITAALIKVNQVGTVTETLQALQTARDNHIGAMISHRSGETPDAFAADLAVGSGVGQLKSGAPARGERTAKYNRLLEIEDEDPGLPYGLPD